MSSLPMAKTVTFSAGAPGGLKIVVHDIDGTLVRQRAPQLASSRLGSVGWRPKRRLKQTEPSGSPLPMLVGSDEPPSSLREMLVAYWCIMYMTCASEGSIATVPPSPPKI